MTQPKQSILPETLPLIDRRQFLIAAQGLGVGLAMASSGIALAQKKTPGTIVYGLSAFPPSLKPFQHTGTAANSVKLLIFRGLLGYDSKGKIVAELAERWRLEGDRTYVFNLRANAKFHNGLPVTADDVKFSFAAIAAPKSGAYLQSVFADLEKVEVIDPLTIRIVLKLPTPSFLERLAGPYAFVISAQAAAADPNNAVGAGPYTIVNSEKGVSIELKKFPEFFKPGLPKSATVRMVVYADESLRVSALLSGNVDIIEYVPWQNMGAISSNPDLLLQEAVGPFMYIIFNCKNGPFADKRVRQAVAHAIKREDIVKAAFFGRGMPLAGMPIDANSEYFDPASANLWPYNPDLARKLLKEAGAENLQVTLLSTATYNMHKDTAEIVQQHLQAVGMQVKLSLPEWGVRVAQGNKGQYEFAINGGNADTQDPDGLTSLLGGGSPTYRRSFGFDSPRVEELLAKGRHIIDVAKRKAIYKELGAAVAEEVPIASLTWRTQAYAMRRYVKGFDSIPGTLNPFSGYTMERTYIE